jgi:uncharacterized membrane protein YphA (DoxX/SURF4 family)
MSRPLLLVISYRAFMFYIFFTTGTSKMNFVIKENQGGEKNRLEG